MTEYQIRSSAAVARTHVGRRDKGICALCAVDTERLRVAAETELRRAEATPITERENWHPKYRNLWRVLVDFEGRDYDVNAQYNTSVYPYMRQIPTLWQADHIVPVAEGGGGCGLENYRTLCVWCHARETGALRKRLNRRSKAGVASPKRSGGATS